MKKIILFFIVTCLAVCQVHAWEKTAKNTSFDPTTSGFVPPQYNVQDIIDQIAGTMPSSPLTAEGSLWTLDAALSDVEVLIGASGTVPISDGSTFAWGPVYQDPLTTRGDVLIRDAANTTARLGVGTAGQALVSDGTDVSWGDKLTDPMTTRGDVLIRDASNTTARLAVGAAGTFLSSDGTDVSWATVNSFSMPPNLVLVDPGAPAITGERYQTWAAADAWVVTQSPVYPTKRIGIKITGNNSENIVLRSGVPIIGVQGVTNLTGSFTSTAAAFVDGEVYGVRITNLSISGANSIIAYSSEVAGGTPTGGIIIPTDNTLMSGGTYTGAFGVFGSRSTISGGTYTGLQLTNGNIDGGTFTNGVFTGCYIADSAAIAFTGSIFRNCEIQFLGSGGMTFNAGDYTISNGFSLLPTVVVSSGSWNISDATLDGGSLSIGGTGNSNIKNCSTGDGSTFSVVFNSTGTITTASNSEEISVTGTGTITDATPVGSTTVTASAVIADDAIVRGDGGSRGTQSSSCSIDDSGNLTCPGTIAGGSTITIDGTGNPGTITESNGNLTFSSTSITIDGDLTADSIDLVNGGNIEITIDPGEGVPAAIFTQNDTSGNPDAVQIFNSGTGDALAINTTQFVVDTSGNLTLSGTVDGVDVATLGSDFGNLPTELQSLTSGEATQLLNIGTTTISGTQWGYLGALDQGLTQSSNVTFNQITGTLQTAAQTNITSVGSLTSLDVTNNITVGGTVDGVDIGQLKLDFDNLPTELQSLTSGEATQLLNIGVTTISGTQWGYLGALNQALGTGDNVTFNQFNGIHQTGSLTSGITAVTQTQGDNSTKIATTAYVDAAITVFGTEFDQNSSDGESSITGTTAYEQKVSITTGTVPAGTYRIGFSFEWQSSDDDPTKGFGYQIQIDNTTTTNTGNMATRTIDDGWMPGAGHWIGTLTNAIHTIDLDYKTLDTGKTSKIRRARLEIWRVE